MPMRDQPRTNFLNGASLFIVAAVLSVVGVYFIFDFYMDSLSRELMSNWVQSEAVNIEEGNLLTSITKSQRTLLASQFVKRVTLFDMAQKYKSTTTKHVLVIFGAGIAHLATFILADQLFFTESDYICNHR